MKCLAHGKETTKGCVWCGKRLCEMCVVKEEGKKSYCEKCAIRINLAIAA